MQLRRDDGRVYAILSFTLARRTREIGVRVALGAGRRQIVRTILPRPARHVAAGVVIGAALGTVVAMAASEDAWRPMTLGSGALPAGYAAVMMGVCMLASIVPMRRALRIEPMEALNAEA